MAEKPLDSPAAKGERAYLPPASPPRNHGHTVAAWVTVTVVMVGAAIASGAVVAALPWLFWVGIGVVVLGVLVGLVLRKAGFGQPEPSGPRRGAAGDDVATPSGEDA